MKQLTAGILAVSAIVGLAISAVMILKKKNIIF